MSSFESGIRSGSKPVDNASVTFFRFCFGILMANWAWDYLSLGIVTRIYVEPKFHFTYYLFDWVTPWPGQGMYVHFSVMCLLACFIAAGFCYRISCLLFAICFTYVFLLERTNYQNHYYLIGLIACWLPWMPLNRHVSVDAWLWPNIKEQTIPAWTLWMLRFHIALPYFFGGVAKINPDWMLGEPLSQMLVAKASLPIIGPALAHPALPILLAWIAMVFDLAIVPLLILKRTRAIAYIMCIGFHMMNSVVFNIHVFPWFMIAATPLFFEPDWPRRLLAGTASSAASHAEDALSNREPVRLGYLATGFMICYVAFHCSWPLRHLVYPGDASWDGRGHYFAWRMMLRGNPVVLGYAITDRETGQVVDGQVNRFLSAETSEKFGRDPEMILHLAHFLGDQYRISSGHRASVHVLALASLNGRKPELLIDPNVDLTTQSRGFYQRQWVLPQREPLRKPAWNLPPEQWRQYVDIPELRFLNKPTESSVLARQSDSSDVEPQLKETSNSL
jgi:vitamin K-dependent gamma-carboxylase